MYTVPKVGVLTSLNVAILLFFRWTASEVKSALGRSVFKPNPKGAAMDTILTSMFHRLSATLYLIYCIWAVISTIDGIPSLARANGEQWQTLFSMAVFIFAAPSCFGATFWPSFARLELFAGAAFTTLLGIYIFFLFGNAIFHGGAWSGVVVIGSVLVVPLARLIIVIVFLLRQAEERKQMLATIASVRQSAEGEAK